MPHIVAVDENLRHLKEYLNEQDFQTTNLAQTDN